MFRNFLENLSLLLTNSSENTHKVFRIHNKYLEKQGDVSFAVNLDFSCWKHLQLSEKNNCKTIFEFASDLHQEDINEETIVQRSQQWPLQIKKCEIVKGKQCHLFLERKIFTGIILKEILTLKDDYGKYTFEKHKFNVLIDETISKEDVEANKLDLTQLRAVTISKILQQFFSTDNSKLNDEKIVVNIYISNKSSDKLKYEHFILCGSVLNAAGNKETDLTSKDLLEEYSSNMRMMFEHKFGLRNIANQFDWKRKIENLGCAAVTLQMIQNNPQKTISLASKHHIIKDAAFIIYNCARISNILNRFSAECTQNIYPALPELENVDFSLLKHEEEWTLIFAYLLQFPSVVQQSIEGVLNNCINLQKLFEFLVSFSTAFSSYYSRIKVLTDPRTHLFPALFARIYLLKAVHQVFLNGLFLLNIKPVSYM